MMGDATEPLSSRQSGVIRKRPEAGAAMLESAAHTGHAAVVVRSHPEKYGGAAYLKGIKRDGIPLGARLLAADKQLCVSDNSTERSFGSNERDSPHGVLGGGRSQSTDFPCGE
jgi:hypothetical protein